MTHKVTLSGSGRGHVTQFPNFRTPHNFRTKQAIRFKFGTEMEDGPSLCRDYKTPLSGRGRDHVSQFPNLVPLYNFRTNRAIRFKFAIQIKDGPFLRTGISAISKEQI